MIKKQCGVDIDALMVVVRRLPASKAKAILDAVGLERYDLIDPESAPDQIPGPQKVLEAQG